MNKFLQFFRLLPALIFALVMCTSCEDAGGDVDEIPTYTVTFETYGGSAISAVKVESGSKVSKPTNPTKDNETFVGWYSDEEQTETYDFDEVITSDITLYALWKINTFTVDFDSCGGSEVESQEVEYNTPAAEPENPTKEGYSFNGWYSDVLLNNKWSFTTKITSNITLYAKWSANQYTITFETNGGTEIAPISVEYDSTAKLPDNPTKEGCSFAGWYVDEAFSEAWDVNTKITTNITLYAKWNTNQYTVSFESNGGSSIDSQNIAHNETASMPTDPTKTGYSFDGWYLDLALTTIYNFDTAVTKDIILYAKWSTNKYTVTFDSNGGSNVDSQNVNYNETATEPTAPTKMGYTFTGWYSDAELTIAYNFKTAVTENITLYAKWTINQYTVTFDSKGGSAVSSQTVDYNTTATEPTAPTKNGYTFAGWYSDSALTTAYNFSTAVTENITLYARWSTNQYSVSFESNGGSSVTTQYVDYNATVTKPTDPIRSGYTFVGWYSDSSLTTAYNFNTAVTENITLYAKWTINQYTVTFNSNGGTNVDDQTRNYNTLATKPADPTRTGYTFEGWYSNSALTTAYNFNAAVTENITLYAKWTINQYTVTFNSNGGTKVDDQTRNYNTLATKPADPTRTGYTFVGWYSNSALTTAYNFNAAVTENITLYAKWTINKYTVTFNSNGGSTVASLSVDYNNIVVKPSDPTRTGYTFVGWYSNSALTTAYNFNTSVTENITLYAKWTINQYTVTFNSNGGTKVENQLRDYNTTATEPTTPTRDGYTFEGWYSNASLTTKWDFETKIMVDTTIYAKWVSTSGELPDLGTGNAW